MCLQIYHLERADGCGRSYENVIQTYVRIAALCVIPILVRSAMSYLLVGYANLGNVKNETYKFARLCYTPEHRLPPLPPLHVGLQDGLEILAVDNI